MDTVFSKACVYMRARIHVCTGVPAYMLKQNKTNTGRNRRSKSSSRSYYLIYFIVAHSDNGCVGPAGMFSGHCAHHVLFNEQGY